MRDVSVDCTEVVVQSYRQVRRDRLLDADRQLSAPSHPQGAHLRHCRRASDGTCACACTLHVRTLRARTDSALTVTPSSARRDHYLHPVRYPIAEPRHPERNMTVDNPPIRQVTSADPDTVDRLAEVMAEAFNTRDDPMYDALYGGDTVPDVDGFNLIRCKGRVYDAIVNKLVFVIEEDGKIAAFATVFPPGVHS